MTCYTEDTLNSKIDVKNPQKNPKTFQKAIKCALDFS